MKDYVLGEDYELSLAFVGTARSQTLNRAYRGKDNATNVLSFPLSKKSGEIVITPQVARREARASGMSEKGYLGFLFIHGLLHLDGYAHGSRMTKKERELVKHFSLR